MNFRGPGGTIFQSVRLYQMLITNGTCVSTIVNSRAGRRGNRRRQDSLRGGGCSLRRLEPEAPTAPAVAVIGDGASLRRRLRRDGLAVLDGRVDRAPAGYHRRELLGALVAHVLELGNPDILHPRQTGTLRGARVV